MTGHDDTTTVGQLPNAVASTPTLPALLTRLVWMAFAASAAVAAAHLWTGATWTLAGVAAVDGFTVTMWVVVAFFSGVVHSYSLRYMAGNRDQTRFFVRTFGFTLAVGVLVAAQHLALFVAAWAAMGLAMADLVGHVRGWPQARAAATLARRYFLAATGLVGVAAGVLWWATGATTLSGVAAGADAAPTTPLFVAAGALVLAAMVQSALVPFHTWLLASMTAPTPASALMHAGFVNAGGVLLVRFAPVVTADPAVMLAVVVVGAASALLGNLLKTVQVDAKGRLGCSTVGQMGFMVMQAGLGFFAAAVAHLALHGLYKSYLFLSTGEQIAQASPTDAGHGRGGPGAAGAVVTAASAVAGGALFGAITGKGDAVDAGLLLTGLVVLTTMHATLSALRGTALPAAYRYAAVPAVFLPAVALYGVAYRAVAATMAGLPVVAAPAELSVVHGLVAAGFLAAYAAVETGAYRHSDRLYVALRNATQPPSTTTLTDTEEYDAY